MKDFFKENFALVLGILLPLGLVAIFFMAGRIADSSAPNPQYDAVLASYSATQPPYDTKIVDGEIVITKKLSKIEYTGPGTPPEPYSPDASIYVLDHTTHNVRKLDLDFVKAKNGTITSSDLTDLNKRGIIGGSVSPDGYQIVYNSNSYNGVFDLFFSVGQGRNGYYLEKNTRKISVASLNYYNASVIGWVKNDK